MMKPMIIGIWGCIATLAGAYGGVYWRTHANDTAKSAAHEEKLETRKIKPITVPIIGNGVVKGYILAEFSLVSPKGDPHDHTLDPEGYFLDEAYRLIYGWKDKDFTNMPTSDVAEMTRLITEKVNQRIGKEVVKEALVTNFGFIPRDELQH
jgi:hypothetical protein